MHKQPADSEMMITSTSNTKEVHDQDPWTKWNMAMAIPMEWIKNGLTKPQMIRLQQAWYTELANQTRRAWKGFDIQRSTLIKEQFAID